MKLVSIVVPIYNVEKYLLSCIESLIQQTYKNIEIILVDDGSPDNSGKICDKYKEIDSRITVIHKENGGLSDARNAGLKIANGEYILFIDSDDYVEHTMIEYLYNACEQAQADMSVCLFDNVKEDDTDQIGINRQVEYKIYSGKEVMSDVYTGNGESIAFTAWNKMYKKELLIKNDILYPKGKYYEDTFTTYKMFYYANTVAVVELPLYHYRLRGNSIINSNINRKKCMDGAEADISAVEFFDLKEDKELFELALYSYCRSIMRTYKIANKIESSEEKKYCIQYISKEFKEKWKRYCKKSDMNIIKKMVFHAFCICPKIINNLI